ncbi:hypothetical protein BG005_003907 [Podila minutissima]|nr:hypothetical protein BG005_003907 [Podila minutissima]
MLTHAPIALRNPFSILEHSSTDAILGEKCPTSTDLVAHVDDDDLDLSSWSVVNSACSSDNEDDEDAEDEDGDSDEIYADDETADGAPLNPLTLSSLKSGFTNISKAATARSINSLAACAPENRGHWVLKVGKRKQRREEGKKKEGEEEEEESLISLDSDRTSTPSLSSDREEDEEEEDEDEDEAMYMRMTERELSKSARAVRIKNGRVALEHDRDLVKSLGLNLTEVPEWSDKASSVEEKPVLRQQQQQQQQAQNPKKTLQKMRAPRSKSKSNKNSKKAKIHADI